MRPGSLEFSGRQPRYSRANGVSRPIRQAPEQGVVRQLVVFAVRLEGEQVLDGVDVNVAGQPDEAAARQLVEQAGPAHLLPPPSQVSTCGVHGGWLAGEFDDARGPARHVFCPTGPTYRRWVLFLPLPYP